MAIKNPPLERDILRAITDYLEATHTLYLRVNPISPIFSKEKGRQWRKVRQSQRGAPDLIVWSSKGKTMLVEVKGPRGVQSEEQKLWEDRAVRRNIYYTVVRSFDEFASRLLE